MTQADDEKCQIKDPTASVIQNHSEVIAKCSAASLSIHSSWFKVVLYQCQREGGARLSLSKCAVSCGHQTEQ